MSGAGAPVAPPPLPTGLGPVSGKSRKPLGPEKPFVKLRPANSGKLVFSCVVKGIEIKITAKFRASRRLRFEDTKKNYVTRNAPEKFQDFRETGPWYVLNKSLVFNFSWDPCNRFFVLLLNLLFLNIFSNSRLERQMASGFRKSLK